MFFATYIHLRTLPPSPRTALSRTRTSTFFCGVAELIDRRFREGFRGIGRTLEACGGLDEFRGILPRWNRTCTGLASGCFRPTEKATEIPKPIPGQKTCTAAAHSQQVALEECLLDCTLLPDGSFQNITAITHSWASGLVYIVRQTAVGVLEPSVLVHETSGSAYLIVLSLGRCVWGWPLRVHNAGKMLLVMVHPIRALVPIVLTSPHLGPAIPSQVQEPHSFFRLGHSVNPTHFPTTETKHSSGKPNKFLIARIRW